MKTFGVELITCHWCECQTWKSKKEIERQRRKGRNRFFCSTSCSAKFLNHSSGKVWKKGQYPEHLRQFNERNRKYKHGVTWFKMIRRAKTRDNGCDLTPEYLDDLWNKQGGRCVLTGIPLEFFSSRTGKSGEIHSSVSLDRKDNSQGYRQGNVQFVVLGINYAKNRNTDADVKALIEKIVQYGGEMVSTDQ